MSRPRLSRLLAVTHEATITGAPINLAHFLEWVTANTDVEVHTLALRDGPLVPRFRNIGDVTVLDRSSPAKALSIVQQGLLHLGSSRAWKPVARARLRPQLRHLAGFDAVYLNSAASVDVVDHLPGADFVISHVHELQVALRTAPPHQKAAFRERPDLWIAASDAVRRALVEESEVPDGQVAVHHEFIDAQALSGRSPDPRETARLRREADIPDGAAVVVGAGTLDWRKGPDLFIQLAGEVQRRSRERVTFVWIGGETKGTDWERLRADLERTGADVRFTGLKLDPFPWFAMADVFALTSREDPFPLVCLEHAAMGCPIVTYRNGGMVELLEAAGADAARGIVDYLDVGAMADRVIDLLVSADLRRSVGTALQQRVVEEHDVSVAAPRLLAEIEGAMAARVRSV